MFVYRHQTCSHISYHRCGWYSTTSTAPFHKEKLRSSYVKAEFIYAPKFIYARPITVGESQFAKVKAEFCCFLERFCRSLHVTELRVAQG